MARILDTLSTFDAFAGDAALQTPAERDRLWRDRYQGTYTEVFAGFHLAVGSDELNPVALRHLSSVRERAHRAGPLVRKLIEELEPKVRDHLGRPAAPEPLHVLMVGGFQTNATVGRVGDDVAVFHCVEWFQSREGTSVLIAHEDSHAWHELAVEGAAAARDPTWLAFYEGIGVHASRAAVPGRPDKEYFWYDQPGFDNWVPWCQAHRQELLDGFAALLEDPDAYEAYFGAGLVNDQRRVGYFIADQLVAGLGTPLGQLMELPLDEGRARVRAALGLS